MLKSDGSPNEENSPFFKENKNICEFWDNFINNKGGLSEGKYTAWSLILTGSFHTNHSWKVRLKKSTLSNGHLLISAEKNIFKQTVFIASELNLGEKKFLIRQSKFVDKLKTILNPNKTSLPHNPNYTLLGQPKNNCINKLIKILETPMEEGKLKRVKYIPETKQLMIDIRDLITNNRLINDITNFL